MRLYNRDQNILRELGVHSRYPCLVCKERNESTSLEKVTHIPIQVQAGEEGDYTNDPNFDPFASQAQFLARELNSRQNMGRLERGSQHL